MPNKENGIGNNQRGNCRKKMSAIAVTVKTMGAEWFTQSRRNGTKELSKRARTLSLLWPRRLFLSCYERDRDKDGARIEMGLVMHSHHWQCEDGSRMNKMKDKKERGPFLPVPHLF